MKICKVVFLLVFLVQIKNLQAQNLEIGGEFGVNLARLETSGKFDLVPGPSEILTRLNISFVAESILSDRFSIDLALGYRGKGGGDFEEGNKLRQNIEGYNVKLEYIGLSTLLRYYFLNNEAIRPFLEVGPGFAYLISAKELGNTIQDENLRSKLEVSSMAGLGLKFPVAQRLSLEFSGAWIRGWTRTLRENGETLYNENFRISVGVKRRL